MTTQHIEKLIIGAGQAGLSTGYHLQQLGRPFLIVDGHERIGDNWRHQWDTLKLYSPAKYDSLPGMPFPAPASHWPTGREMADYLEAYARHFDLPVRSGQRVERVDPVPAGFGFVVTVAGGHRIADAGDRGDGGEARRAGGGPFPARPAAAAEAGQIDARPVDSMGREGAVEQGIEPGEIPILVSRQLRGDHDEREAGIAVGDLRRAVRLDLIEVVAALAGAVEEDK